MKIEKTVARAKRPSTTNLRVWLPTEWPVVRQLASLRVSAALPNTLVMRKFIVVTTMVAVFINGVLVTCAVFGEPVDEPNANSFGMSKAAGEQALMAAWAEHSFSAPSLREPKRPAIGQEPGLSKQIPFSFRFGGKSSADLLAIWERREKQQSSAECDLRTITYTDRQSGMEVQCEVKTFKDFPGVEWVLRFTNKGKAISDMLESVLPLDLDMGLPAGDVVLHRANGSRAGPTDFVPIDEKLAPDASVKMAPNGGKSSDGVLPFFNLQWNGGGLVWAVGWSGQWAQQIQRNGADRLQIKAGQQTLRARLNPGESIRTPRILLVSWQGTDRFRGHNLLRRLLLAHYVPRRDGEIVMPPVSQNCWFLYDEGNGTTEENQLKHIRAMPELGIETYWLDAGWFEGGWPNGVGSWVPRADHFPRGLKPLGDEAHELGLKFIAWFEPERVDANSRIAKEHPEFVLGWNNKNGTNGYVDLGSSLNPMVNEKVTLSAWVNPIGGTVIMMKGNDAAAQSYGLEWADNAAYLFTHASTPDWLGDGGATPVNQWNYVTGVINGTNKYLYVDGVLQANDTFTGSIGSTSNSFWLGAQNRTDPYKYYLAGALDEVRTASVARSTNWIFAEWLNMASNSVFNFYGTVKTNIPDFSPWHYGSQIAFSGYTKAETLTNFPALVNIGTNLSGFAWSQFANTNGYELRFTDTNGNELSYDRDFGTNIVWTNGAGIGQLWVKVPVLNSNTVINAYWGNPAATGSLRPYCTNGAVWANGFAGVWHLPSAPNLDADDSTANLNNGTISNATARAGVIGGAASFHAHGGDGCFNLGDPVARRWLTDYLSKFITDSGIDIYRTDFNFAPLRFWLEADEPDRQGITENHYIEGLYTMWDELHQLHPNLVFDDCASGGRRIDLEMISRSYSLSRSDSVGFKTATPAWDQAQTAGLSLYVPVNATLSVCGLPEFCDQPMGLYQLRSAATSGISVSQDNFAKDFPADLFRKVITEVKELRPLYNGDFYPLTPINVNEDTWCGWQFDRPELGRGFALFFRRPKAMEASFQAALHGLDTRANYEVKFPDSGQTQRLSGSDLSHFKCEIPEAPGTSLLIYRKLDRNR